MALKVWCALLYTYNYISYTLYVVCYMGIVGSLFNKFNGTHSAQAFKISPIYLTRILTNVYVMCMATTHECHNKRPALMNAFFYFALANCSARHFCDERKKMIC